MHWISLNSMKQNLPGRDLCLHLWAFILNEFKPSIAESTQFICHLRRWHHTYKPGLNIRVGVWRVQFVKFIHKWNPYLVIHWAFHDKMLLIFNNFASFTQPIFLHCLNFYNRSSLSNHLCFWDILGKLHFPTFNAL